jgi:hypothetical protein
MRKIVVPPPNAKPRINSRNFEAWKIIGADSPRKPAYESLALSLLISSSVFGCSGLAKAGEAASSMRDMASVFLPVTFSPARLRAWGSLMTSKRLSVREPPREKNSMANHAIAAINPKTET